MIRWDGTVRPYVHAAVATNAYSEAWMKISSGDDKAQPYAAMIAVPCTILKLNR